MLVECWSVILIVLAICVVYLKSHRNQYAFTVLPLCILPFAHIIGGPLSRWIHPYVPLNHSETAVVIDLLGLALATLFLGLTSKNIRSKKARVGFLICCTLFDLILAAVLVESNIV
ncbi:hypothetical protein [Zongyangia hominis]|uniref:Uncharacterized protein n=1 Tax=Zongyangia hominis TaxID=2763677 RepID=A0A926ECH9_9FIRM|nr:hypothetical protein [Zongyangia hominis]MBC8569854.1 hypothetical protein [Zongyangia hominis]